MERFCNECHEQKQAEKVKRFEERRHGAHDSTIKKEYNVCYECMFDELVDWVEEDVERELRERELFDTNK